MLDFASSLYLGLRHESRSLESWDALTVGRPAALQESAASAAAARELAALVGCEAGTLLPSTFHLFWDLLGVLSREPIVIYMDAATYPIARWSAEHWAGRGVSLLPFPRHDAARLARRLGQRRAARPLVLSDGVCPGSNSQPPLAAYAALAQQHGCWLVIDDTQALGVLGHNASAAAPYGLKGGGSLQWQSIAGDHVVVGASLAKGFGVSVALLAGSATLLQRFERASACREHASPPSMAVVQAVRRALAVNRQDGDRIRLRLWRAVRRLRVGLGALGLVTQGNDFPVQTLVPPPGTKVRQLHSKLLRRNIRTVLPRDRCGGARLSFLVGAGHSAADIDCAVAQLAQVLCAPMTFEASSVGWNYETLFIRRRACTQ